MSNKSKRILLWALYIILVLGLILLGFFLATFCCLGLANYC